MGGSDLISTRVFQSAACRGHRLPETQKRKEMQRTVVEAPPISILNDDDIRSTSGCLVVESAQRQIQIQRSHSRVAGTTHTHTRRTDVRTDDGIFLIDGKVASPRVQTLARKRQGSQKPSLSSLCADDLPSSQLRRAEFLLRPILRFSRPRLPAKRFSRRAESESTSQSQGARAR